MQYFKNYDFTFDLFLTLTPGSEISRHIRGLGAMSACEMIGSLSVKGFGQGCVLDGSHTSLASKRGAIAQSGYVLSKKG